MKDIPVGSVPAWLLLWRPLMPGDSRSDFDPVPSTKPNQSEQPVQVCFARRENQHG
jgi:hypothetical protein